MSLRNKLQISDLVNTMLATIPDTMFASSTTTFLDPSIGGGQFLVGLQNKLKSFGHSDENVKSRVFGWDMNRARLIYAHNEGVAATLAQKDIFNETSNMKFDVIISNPPYQKTAEHGKKINDNLWAPFIFKSWELIKDDGYLAIVCPDNWRTPTNDYRTKRLSVLKEIIKPFNTIAINMNEAEKYFNVGTTVSYFITQKSPSTNNTQIISNWGTSNISLESLPCIPKDLSVLGLSIFNKVMNDSSPKWNFEQKQTKLNKSLDIVDTEDAEHRVPFFESFGGKPIRYANKQGDNHNDAKIMLSYVGTYSVLADSGSVTPAQHTHRQLLNKEELVGAESQFKSKLYSYLIGGNRANQYIEKHTPNMMPMLDLHTNWTDEMIYKHFNFTQEEINYIEETV